jgi:hypothetical protein
MFTNTIGMVDMIAVNFALLAVQSLIAVSGNLTAINRSMDMAARNRPDTIPLDDMR